MADIEKHTATRQNGKRIMVTLTLMEKRSRYSNRTVCNALRQFCKKAETLYACLTRYVRGQNGGTDKMGSDLCVSRTPVQAGDAVSKMGAGLPESACRSWFQTAQSRTRGTPQGGVVSPILMKLFMHYAFDCWMGRSFPHSPFARYADDAVVHCRSLKQAQEVMQSIAARLEECGLAMHPEKSTIVYCKDSGRRGGYRQVQFTFLGFTFRPRRAQDRRGRVFASFLPAVSKDALKRMRQQLSSWKLQRQNSAKLAELARQCNPVIRGWWNHYGAFYRKAMGRLARVIDRKLALWARRKYKPLAKRHRRSAEWLGKMKQVFPQMFVHWRHAGYKAG